MFKKKKSDMLYVTTPKESMTHLYFHKSYQKNGNSVPASEVDWIF